MGKMTSADAFDIGFMREGRALNRTYNFAVWVFCIMLTLGVIVACVSTTDFPGDPDSVYESPDGQTLVISQYNAHILLNNEIVFLSQDNGIEESDIGSFLGAILGFVVALIGLGIALYYTSYYIPEKRKQAGWAMVESMEKREE